MNEHSESRPRLPTPQGGKGDQGGEVHLKRSAPPALWKQLKPLARQMRREPTAAEDRLWQRLRNRQLRNVKFRRQHAIERFIVDFYCPEYNLVMEVDREIHQYSAEEDAIRQQYLENRGLLVLRFSNDQVLEGLDRVIAEMSYTLMTIVGDNTLVSRCRIPLVEREHLQ